LFMKGKFILAGFVVFLAFSASLAQSGKVVEIPVQDVEGMAVGSPAESLEEVRARAVSEAKVQALKQVGVAEQLMVYSDFFKSEEAGNYEEIFTSDILTSMQGAVKNIEVVKEDKYFTEEGTLVVKVQIDGTVVRYNSTSDPAFSAEVDGLKMFYDDNTPLKFRVKPTKEAWLQAFLLSESEAFVLFPNDYEPLFQMQPEQWYNFPTTYIDYLLETNEGSEMHRLVLVLSKKKISYQGGVDYKSILDWIFTLPPDIRYVETHAFSIVNAGR
ncbi:MAG: hypothetical protein ACQESW_13755, partial [Bacteroidota bacterium]